MTTSQERENLKQLIIEAFKSVPKPEVLALHDCAECDRLRQDYEGKDWRNLPTDLIDTHAGDLSLLSPEAFRYFLPAYICQAIDDWDPYQSEVVSMTIYALAPTRNKDYQEWNAERYQFTKRQISAIKVFFDLVSTDPTIQLYHNDIQRGREAFRDLIQKVDET